MNIRTIKTFFAALAASSIFLSAGTALAQIADPGDLTITVRENADRSVTFSATGTANALNSGPFPPITTTDPESSNPPVNFAGTGDFPLPPGITLTIINDIETSVEEGEPEEVSSDTRILPVTAVVFAGDTTWGLGRFVDEVFIRFNSPITGAGSVTVNNIPFSHFVPGTYTVEAEQERARNFRLYQVTYRVIPYVVIPDVVPRLTLTSGAEFPQTKVDEYSKHSRRLTLRNVGDAPASNLSLRLIGDSSDFVVATPRIRGLAPGASILLRVRFRPTEGGSRRATFLVRSNAPTVSATLSGFGVEPQANSPRFPRGF